VSKLLGKSTGIEIEVGLMPPSSRIVRVARYVTITLVVVTIVLEIISFPLILIFNMLLLGTPSPPLATRVGTYVAAFLPFVVIGALVLCLRELEAHRRFYPIAAGLMVASWITILVVSTKAPTSGPIVVYAAWHLAAVDFILKPFGF
jgi:hypothetical protein